MVSAMGGRRDDSAPGRSALPPVRPSARTPSPRPAPAPVIEEPPSSGRRGWLVVGLVLAAGATAAVFFTENPLYLRVALLAVCWAFVVAAFVAGSRRTDQVAAAGREAELRHAYDLELEREVAARQEYEADLESRLRREAEEAMRGQLAQLRTELAGLSELRNDLAAVTQLRADLAGLGQLRTEIAALTEIRGELAGLGSIRAELAGLGELRTDLGRMGEELTEQLSGELLIERMVMRAQSVRGRPQPGPSDGRTLDSTPSWEPQAAPQGSEPGDGWDVDRWSETRVVPAEPVEAAPRPLAGPPPVPPRAHRPAVRVEKESPEQHRPPSPVEWLVEESLLEPRPKSPLEWLDGQSSLDPDGQPTGEIPVASDSEPAPRHHRRAAEPDDEEPVGSRVDSWSAEPASYASPSYDRPAYETPAYETPAYETAPATPTSDTGPSYDSSRYDEMLFGTAPEPSPSPYESPSYQSPSYESPSSESAWETPSWESPSWQTSAADSAEAETPSWTAGSTSRGSTGHDGSGYTSATPVEQVDSQPERQGHARLEQILAESGVEVPSGGRSRRRRYRDEDGEAVGDDVLARVLGRN
jgi:hypothetical protein